MTIFRVFFLIGAGPSGSTWRWVALPDPQALPMGGLTARWLTCWGL